MDKKQIKAAHDRLKAAETAANEANSAREKSLAEAETIRAELEAALDSKPSIETAQRVADHDRAVEKLKSSLDNKLSVSRAELEAAQAEVRFANQTESARAVIVDAVARIQKEPANVASLVATVAPLRAAVAAVADRLDTGADREFLKEPLLVAAREVPDERVRHLLSQSIALPRYQEKPDPWSPVKIQRVEVFDAGRALSPISPQHLDEIRAVREELSKAVDALDTAIERAQDLKLAPETIRSKARFRLRVAAWETVVLDTAKECSRLAGDRAVRDLLTKYHEARKAPTTIDEKIVNTYDPKTFMNSIKTTVLKERRLPLDQAALEKAENKVLARMTKVLDRAATTEDLSILETYMQHTTHAEKQQKPNLGRQESETASGRPGPICYANWARLLGNHETIKARIQAELERSVEAELATVLGATKDAA